MTETTNNNNINNNNNNNNNNNRIQQTHPTQTAVRDDFTTLQNPNVRRVLFFCFIDGACFSLWYAQVFQVLINKLSGDTTVGWLSASSGAAQMLSALIVGYAGDIPRQTIIRLGAFSGIVAAALSIYGVSILQVSIFFFSSGLWGIYAGMVATGTEALFADSIETGKRDFAYNMKWINQTLCDCVGSLTSLIMLLKLGNDWDIGSMQKLMFTGLALHPLAHLLLFTMKDKYALDENININSVRPSLITLQEEEEDNYSQDQCYSKRSYTSPESEETLSRQSLLNENNNNNVNNSQFFSIPVSPTNSTSTLTQREIILSQLILNSTRKYEEYLNAQNERNFFARIIARLYYYAYWPFEWTAVPYLVCLVDFLVAVGSGMTMRYIPLYFVNDYHLTPVKLMGTYIAISIATAILSIIVRYLGEYYISRIAAVIAVRTIGTTLLLLMGLTHLPITILIPIFILRNSTMNSTRGVTRSVIMDCVPKATRAKWSAFESFSSFTWAGSAVIGGYIAEAKGYQFTFIITAIFHYVALLTLAPALVGAGAVELVRRQEARENNINNNNNVNNNNNNNNNKRNMGGQSSASSLVQLNVNNEGSTRRI